MGLFTVIALIFMVMKLMSVITIGWGGILLIWLIPEILVFIGLLLTGLWVKKK